MCNGYNGCGSETRWSASADRHSSNTAPLTPSPASARWCCSRFLRKPDNPKKMPKIASTIPATIAKLNSPNEANRSSSPTTPTPSESDGMQKV